MRVRYGFKKYRGYMRESDDNWQQGALFYRLFQGVESMIHDHFYWKRSCGKQLIDRKIVFLLVVNLLWEKNNFDLCDTVYR